MRGILAKRIRKHVRTKYPFLSATPVYIKRWDGVVLLHQTCMRRLSQDMKHNYYKLRRAA